MTIECYQLTQLKTCRIVLLFQHLFLNVNINYYLFLHISESSLKNSRLVRHLLRYEYIVAPDFSRFSQKLISEKLHLRKF